MVRVLARDSRVKILLARLDELDMSYQARLACLYNMRAKRTKNKYD